MFRKEENDVKFNIRWRPFLLNTSTPKHGISRARYFRDKYGITNYAESPMSKHLIKAGEQEGIHFDLTKPDVISYTVDAHRLLNESLKQKPDVQDKIASDLFSKYFEQGIDIGNTKVLQDVAQRHGINLPENYFQSDDGVDEIIDEDQSTKEQEINGVPFFIFNSQKLPQRLAISGAQNTSTFLQILRKLLPK